MHPMKWIATTVAAMTLASGAEAQAPPTMARELREAAEAAARAQAIEKALVAAQVAGGYDPHLAEAAADLAMQRLRIAGQLDHTVSGAEARMALEQARMQMDMAEPRLHAAQYALDAVAAGLAPLRAGPSWNRRLDALRPEFRSLSQDPADSLYRAGREHLNAREWQRAADVFRLIRTEPRYARSGYRADAHYWEAFALAQRGREGDLRRAREVLEQMRRTYPDGQMIRDAVTLATTIDGRLARAGDAHAAESLYRRAELQASRARRAAVGGTRAAQDGQCPQDEQDDIRIAALSALLNVDSDRTVPVLREVLQRRDECSAPLRRRALLLLSRSTDPEAAQVLVETARNDPDESVREQAVLFLGTIRTPEANRALQEMLRQSDDVSVQRRALMALTQQRGEEATALLRDFASRTDVPDELRRHAILLLVSRRSGESDENRAYLRDLFTRTDDDETRSAILHALTSDRSEEGVEWLMNVALDERLPVEQRRQALFIAGRSEHVPVERLVRLYDAADDAELKEHILFALARRSESAAFDKLVSIARNDGDLEIRRKAVFWIGQSADPRAPDVLLELIR